MKISLIVCLLLHTLPLLSKQNKPHKKRSISSLNVNIACESQVLNVLGELETPRNWIELKDSSNEKNLNVFFAETTKPGVSLELGLAERKSRITRRTLGLTTTYDFNEADSCNIKIDNLVTENKNSSFTDLEFSRLVTKNKQDNKVTVIYLWSPSMNLSIKGLEEVTSLSKHLSFELLPLLDPFAKELAARNVIRKMNWPLSYITKMDSATLQRENGLIHFPSVFVLKNGVLSKVRPGYDNPESFINFYKSAIGSNEK
jgi:hypothetical protein